MRTQWTSRVVTDMVGDGRSVKLVALAGYGIAVEFTD